MSEDKGSARAMSPIALGPAVMCWRIRGGQATGGSGVQRAQHVSASGGQIVD